MLTGKRILIVEDEYFIASEIGRALRGAGATVIGPTGNAETGLSLAEELLDAAVLDVNLDGNRSFAIAEQLAARAVPYIFVTGYDGWALPEEHRTAPRLAKPFPTAMLIDQVSRLVEGDTP